MNVPWTVEHERVSLLAVLDKTTGRDTVDAMWGAATVLLQMKKNFALAPPLWTAESEDGNCPICQHEPKRHTDGCNETITYDHMNGYEVCSCPLVPPRETTVE